MGKEAAENTTWLKQPNETVITGLNKFADYLTVGEARVLLAAVQLRPVPEELQYYCQSLPDFQESQLNQAIDSWNGLVASFGTAIDWEKAEQEFKNLQKQLIFARGYAAGITVLLEPDLRTRDLREGVKSLMAEMVRKREDFPLDTALRMGYLVWFEELIDLPDRVRFQAERYYPDEPLSPLTKQVELLLAMMNLERLPLAGGFEYPDLGIDGLPSNLGDFCVEACDTREVRGVLRLCLNGYEVIRRKPLGFEDSWKDGFLTVTKCLIVFEADLGREKWQQRQRLLSQALVAEAKKRQQNDPDFPKVGKVILSEGFNLKALQYQDMSFAFEGIL